MCYINCKFYKFCATVTAISPSIVWQLLLFSESHQFTSGESSKSPKPLVILKIAEFYKNSRFEVIWERKQGEGEATLGMCPDCVLETTFREVISSLRVIDQGGTRVADAAFHSSAHRLWVLMKGNAYPSLVNLEGSWRLPIEEGPT